MCALRRKNIQIRDCPIPPPMVYGSSSLMIAFWKGRSFLSSQPAFFNWESRAFCQHGYPWKIIPVRYQEPDSKQRCQHLNSSHHSQGTSVMAFTIFQNITNLHNADSTFCFCNVILTFLWVLSGNMSANSCVVTKKISCGRISSI